MYTYGVLVSHKNEILSFVAKWMKREVILLSDFSQAQKQASCVLSPTVKTKK